MRPIGSLAIAVLLVSASLGFAAPVRTHYDRAFYTPSEEVVTPHIPWAKPYARGPINALFLVHRQNQREVIELAERLQMKYTVFCAEDPTKFGETGIGVDMGWRLVEGNSSDEMAKQLREDLKSDYDVIVVGNIKWDEFPLDCRYEILKKVKAGAGLVGYMPNGHDVYIDRILQNAQFGWDYVNWSGAAQGIADYFGIGDFVGSVDTTEKHSGQCSIRITGREVKMGSKEAPRGGYLKAPIKIEPHTKYHFSAWYKTTPDCQPLLHLYPIGVPVPTPPTDTWKRTEVDFDSGDKTEMGVYLLNASVGTVWYDDVSLTKTGDDTNLLPNPGFENPGPIPGALTDAFPYASLPQFRNCATADAFARGVFQTTTFGQGRVALLNLGGIPITQAVTPPPQGPMRTGQLDYDYYLALAIRAILWGAKKEPPISIHADAALVTAARDQLKGAVTFALSSATDGDCGWVCTVRNRVNRTWAAGAGRVSLTAGTPAPVVPSLPRLPAGSYFVDLTLFPASAVALAGAAPVEADAPTVSFGSVGLEVTSTSAIAKLSLAKSAFSKTEPLVGIATVTSPAASQALQVCVYDNLDRLIGQWQGPAAPQTPFSIKPLPPHAIVCRVEASLVSGKDVLDIKEAPYSVTDLYPDTQDMRHVMWTSPGNDFISPYVLREFRNAGVDTQYTNFTEMVPAANLWHIPMATRFTDNKTDWYQPKTTRLPGDLVRDPCLTDPKYRAEVKDTLTKAAQTVAPYSTLDFSLGDECMFVNGNWDLCMSPTCNADFRAFAQKEYGTLDKVNAEWGTSYKTWDEIVPITLEQAKATGHLPQWVDHRRHMESVYAGIYGYSRDVIRGVVPKARVGYEGSDTEVGSFHADDYWKLSQVMDFNNIYYRDFLTNAVRDFAPPDMLLGAGWYGGYPNCRNDAYMHWFPWRALFKGSNSLWVWMGYGTAGGVMGYDLSLYPFYKTNCAEVNEIKAGPGKLLLTSERRHDGIALLWSASSVHAAQFTDGMPPMDTTLNDLVQVIHDIGLECKVVSYEQLAQGKVTTDEFKVLMLPCCQALSTAEVTAIGRFAADGGTVIADLRPGVCDEHGKPYSAGALDDLFGVKLDTAKFARAVGDLKLSPTSTLRGVVMDGGVTATTGSPWTRVGNVPVIIGRNVGKGQAILLNLSLSGYALAEQSGAKQGDFGGWAAGGELRSFVTSVFGMARVRPSLTTTPELPHLEISRFRNGAAEYVGLIQSLPRDSTEYTNLQATVPEGKTTAISFPHSAHVYDVRAGKYLGLIATLQTTIDPGIAKLYALLPYRVDGLKLWTPPQAKLGAALDYAVTVIAAGAKPGTHIFHIRASWKSQATGHETVYEANVLGKEGRATGKFDLALNDPAGRWTLTARDVATGTTATTAFTVK
jgi:beta-galactosidase